MDSCIFNVDALLLVAALELVFLLAGSADHRCLRNLLDWSLGPHLQQTGRGPCTVDDMVCLLCRRDLLDSGIPDYLVPHDGARSETSETGVNSQIVQKGIVEWKSTSEIMWSTVFHPSSIPARFPARGSSVLLITEIPSRSNTIFANILLCGM